ncbi:thioredoxin domain-containing protein [Pelagerythrobacter marensis]|uniref:Protein-disulfide isomerase n=1 Tax=Pelagerythrobacter marensis TaxID=543877 RepID=A0A0G3XAB1_9SPHN|nr:thioredoxin domain-containing protein [Pelagerythrobacter marensis]AKM07541.1 protein-disulfide isomerase [Pelagerythrobacter marensis]
MKVSRLARAAVLAGAAFLALGNAGNWNTQVVEENGAHRIGKPDAKVHLTAFVSYTCPACARFATEGDPALQLAYIAPGRLELTVQPLIRNSADLVATMLTACGAPGKFARNHKLFMHKQGEWLDRYYGATSAQRARWEAGSQPSRRRAIASDLGFYKLMESRGYSRVETDRCLADDSAARALIASSAAAAEKHDIHGTPSFVVDGVTLAGTHDWSMLSPQLSARF